MVSAKQKREIKRLMRRVKDAKDNDMPEKVIKERTNDLYNYLASQGILDHLE